METSITFDISVHYWLEQEGHHKMDAKRFNECQKNLINGFDRIKLYTNSDVKIEVGTRQNGGVIEGLFVTVVGGVAVYGITEIIKAIHKKFFSKEEKISAPSEKVRLEIWENLKPKLEQGTITEDEALYLFSNDTKLVNCISNFYKQVRDEKQVKSITATTRTQNETIANEDITRVYYNDKIIEDTSYQESEEISGTDIQIISPVLQNKHGETWRGIYSGISIDFKIEDKEFLKQVYNNEIKFGSYTVIRCNLTVIHIYNEEGIEEDKKKKYIVKSVISWADDETLKFNETKTYKRIKEDKRQMSLEFEI